MPENRPYLSEDVRRAAEAAKAFRPRRYGVPYQGSKNGIAKGIVDFLPSAKHFYDCFAGGCAISHAAILSGKYEYVHINDINDCPSFFMDAVNGRYENERRVIDKKTFHALKEKDPLIRYCWSFAANGRSYAWGDDFAALQQEACHMLLADTWQERRRHWLAYHRILNTFGYRSDVKYRSLSPLERIEGLIDLEVLRPIIEKLGGVFVSKSDYRELNFEPDAVIYCDPPYRVVDGSLVYGKNFDFNAFDTWAKSQKNIFISEYTMPDGFVPVWEREKRCMVACRLGKSNLTIEKIFVPLNPECNSD